MRFSAAPVDSPVEQYFAPPDVHELNRETAPGKLLAFIFSCLLAIAHGLNLYSFLPEFPWTALIVHVLLVIITAVVARVLIASGRDSRFLMLLLITTATTGVFGAVGTALSILLHRFHTRRSMPFIDWFISIFPSEEESLSRTIYDKINIGRDEAVTAYSVVPFLEVMELGSELQKREAITRMTVRFHPNFAPAFKRALQDESNTIRVQAATAITIIEHEFSERLIRLADLYRKMPSDPIVVQALAEHYDNYAFTGLLDPERERGNRDQALKYYLEYLKLLPRDEKARVSVGRLMLRRGEAGKAADWFRDCVNQGFRSDAIASWQVEALFNAGRYGELRQVAAQSGSLIEQFREVSPRLTETLQLWSGRAVPSSLSVEAAP